MKLALGLGLGCALLGLLACAKVANPFYVDELGDDATGTASESDSTESGESSESSSTESESSSTDSTDESDSLDSNESSSSDTDCPPSESGCPCLEGTQCFPGLTCIDGICLAPEDCTPENPAVQVLWSYDINGMQPAADTACTLTPMVQGSALTLTLGPCDDGVTMLSVVLDPLPPGFPDLVQGPSIVRIHFEQNSAFIRLGMGPFNLWLVEGGVLASGNAAVSDYPGEILDVVGECPSHPKFCGQEIGELKRRGIRMLGLPIYDGSMASIDPTMAGWVDQCRVDCLVHMYRFALVDW